MGFFDFVKKGIGKVAGIAGTAALGPIGGALVGWGANKLLGGGGGGGGKVKRARQAFDTAIGEEEGRGTRFSEEYERRALGYDPQETINRSVEGTYNIMMPRLIADQMERRGSSRTGFGAQEEQEYLSNLIASRAFDAEQFRFENMRDIGAYGERARDRTLDARFGRYATESQKRQQEKASKRGLWGQLGGAALGAAGRILAGRI